MFRMLLAAFLLMSTPAFAEDGALTGSVFLEDLTWPEVAARLTTGTTTILIPTGGTEQNGPHIALGKHNWIVRQAAGEMAAQLGNALVAPVMAYVPEGSISPAQGHMLFPGTISVSATTFAAVLEDAARSFKQHGFHTIVFVGDSGGQQDAQKALAARLSKEWKDEGVVVANASAYYADAQALAYAKAKQLGGEEPEA
ncbi:MAG: creatininase family protein, partial [Rickettsiales bacterium]|nr:creatininase family protein [Rickettsiales bacterium]